MDTNNLNLKEQNKMKKALFILIPIIILIFVLTSRVLYTNETIDKFTSMPKPVVLYDKTKNTFWYSVVLKDGNGNLERFGNLSSLANKIGETYQIQDTISH